MSRKKKQIPSHYRVELEIPSVYFDPQNPDRSDLITDHMTIAHLMKFLSDKGITQDMYETTDISIATERFGSCPHFILTYSKQRTPEEIKELEKKAEEEEERKLKESAERKKKLAEKKKKKEAVISKLSKEEKELLGIKV